MIDLVQMDIQGLAARILEEYCSEPSQGVDIQAFLIGTHSESIHERCRDALKLHNYAFLHDEIETLIQPDGIRAAAKREINQSQP